MKRLFLAFLAISIISCSNQTSKNLRVEDKIPANSELVLITPDLEKFIGDLESNEFINKSDFELKRKIRKQFDHLQYFNFTRETVIAFSEIASDTPVYTLITEKDSGYISLDSVNDKIVETVKENNIEYQRIGLNNSRIFLYETENLVVISNSKKRILDFDDQEKTLKSPAFGKALAASDANKTSIFLNHGKMPDAILNTFKDLSFPGIKNFAEWSALDLDISQSAVRLNGISIPGEAKNYIEKIWGLKPQTSEIGKICPTDFISLITISSPNFKEFYKDSIAPDYPEILDDTREVAAITIKDGSFIILNVNEIEAAKEALAGLGEKTEDFRGTPIIELYEEIKFKNLFKDLISLENAQYYSIEDQFVIFSNNAENLKNIISAYQNSDVLANRDYFKDLMNSLSSESNLLLIANGTNFKTSGSSNLKLNKNSLAAFQVITENDFAHLHGIFSNSRENSISKGVEQSISIKVDASITSTPYFFKNHRSDQLDIAVQDENNDLYLISNKGNVFWKRNLDSQITSEIFQVDLFKNGNQQLAFSTGYQMEVLDRNGKKVKGYPIKFNQPLTQPLAVFDYDNNRTYRFVLTQNNKVFMVGPKGRAIKGFDFDKAGSKIIQPPKHIRLGTKDYIIIAEESGKLNILSRQGKIRVPVKEKLNFSENGWFGYQNSFISTNSEHDLVKISQNGRISTSDLNLAENHRITASRNDLIYLSENELNINSESTDLDFGLYTDPQLFTLRDRTLIAITDTQTQKVYVFNDKAELLEGFPVYGTSKVDIANADLDSKLELVVRGEENELLIYKF
ncbi:hypothetical protein [Christiangramia sabulilitoris]|uniref:Uncharacterized protein n=1 Tax=Christiangramia sabulilitoris TaxID=2583991 RepID=A0A550I7U2_9FLAO|nr:hypothetical protein [Christiangramia sabulilitoris]TRO67044.1 hypothetical protein FGM01_03930 [Christiangramia sabulilitoris]